MKFIIYDIEATCWEGRPPGLVQETIEIGAYRLDEMGRIETAFSRLIKPVIHPQLSLFCRQLTGIDQADLNRARSFAEVIQDFVQWAGFYDHPHLLLASWGAFDEKQLRKDCRVHQVEEDWLNDHIDLKAQYRSLRSLPKTRGLQSAVKHEGFEWEGTPHRALDDANNAVSVFRKYIDEWQF